MKTATKGYNLTLPVNNFHLSYDDIGEGKIPVIFLHGFPFDKSMWQRQLEFLESSYRSIACDIRGFGKSTDEKSTLSIDFFANDLIAFMDKLGIEKAIVCGLSMGGYIALNAQKRFPDRFQALVLCDTQCIADSPEAKEKRYKKMDEIERDGVADFYEDFIKSVFHKDSIENKKDIVSQLKSVVFSNSKQIIIEGMEAIAERAETCSTLPEIDIPTLIICGREDGITPIAQSEYMHSKIEGSQLRIIDNAGHVSNLEQPAEFNEHLLNFLKNISNNDNRDLTENQRSKKSYLS